MKQSTKAILTIAALAALFAVSAEAALQMPNYASTGANLSSDIESTGSKVTKIFLLITVIIGILGIIWSGLAFSAGNPEEGKTRLKSAVIGLVIASCATGIAALATGNG